MYVYSCTIMCCTVFGNLFCHPLSWFWAPSCLQQNYRRCKSQKFCPIVFWSCHSRFLRGQCDVFELLCFVQLTGRNQNILGLKGPKIQKTKKCLICEIFKYLFWTSNQWITDIFAKKNDLIDQITFLLIHLLINVLIVSAVRTLDSFSCI